MKVLAFVLIVLVVCGIVHFMIRRFWLGVIIGTTIGGGIELLSEILSAPSMTIRPVDVLFWGPFVALQGAVFSFPMAVIVGAVFYLGRRRT